MLRMNSKADSHRYPIQLRVDMLCLETDLSLCGGNENVTSTVRLHMCSESIPFVPMSDISIELTVPDTKDRGQHHRMPAAR